MSLEKKFCKVCGAEILLKYVTPVKEYSIKDGKPFLTNEEEDLSPYLEFYCSFNPSHDIDTPDVLQWTEEVEVEFYYRLEESLG